MTVGLRLAPKAKQEISAAFPFESRFIEVLGSRMHHVEEGTGDRILFHASPGAIMPPDNLAMVTTALSNLTTVDLGDGIHYLQEDHPHEIGEGIADWYRAS